MRWLFAPSTLSYITRPSLCRNSRTVKLSAHSWHNASHELSKQRSAAGLLWGRCTMTILLNGTRSGGKCGWADQPVFLETPQGYVWGSLVQPTRNLPNVPITAMPAGVSGFWAKSPFHISTSPWEVLLSPPGFLTDQL